MPQRVGERQLPHAVLRSHGSILRSIGNWRRVLRHVIAWARAFDGTAPSSGRFQDIRTRMEELRRERLPEEPAPKTDPSIAFHRGPCACGRSLFPDECDGSCKAFERYPESLCPGRQLLARSERGQPSQLHTASPMTSSRSPPFNHGSSSVNRVTHCRQEHCIRVMSVPQNIRSGPNASKQRCRCG